MSFLNCKYKKNENKSQVTRGLSSSFTQLKWHFGTTGRGYLYDSRVLKDRQKSPLSKGAALEVCRLEAD